MQKINAYTAGQGDKNGSPLAATNSIADMLKTIGMIKNMMGKQCADNPPESANNANKTMSPKQPPQTINVPDYAVDVNKANLFNARHERIKENLGNKYRE